MIYYVNFHNLLPHKKKFFDTKQEIQKYLDKLIKQQIAYFISKLEIIDHENPANVYKIKYLEESLQKIKDYNLADSMYILNINENKCKDYKEIFGEINVRKN